jgi:glutathionylspermidine synthase
MRRVAIDPRAGWESLVESQGFHFHSPGGQPYWDESAYYAFSPTEIDAVERATYALNDLCLKAVDHVVRHGEYGPFGIPDEFVPFLERSWEADEHTVYGRFDLAFAPGSPPKLLEYNADTPTALLEAAVIQWYWLQDTRVGRDQFNSIHERLIEAWKAFGKRLAQPVYFSSLGGHVEDYMTVQYLRDTAIQAGLKTEYLAVEAIRWNDRRRQFVDGQERDIGTIFKLYPWEWMLGEEFGRHLPTSRTRWLEPPWKMLLSNKAILPLLWRLFPECPYLLRAEEKPFGDSFVEKPKLGREGANVRVVKGGQTVVETDGEYDGETVFQALAPLAEFEGNYVVVGSWMVNGYACGVGVREDRHPVTSNTSRFVPHVID